MGKRELEVLGEELLDVRTADRLGVLDLNNLKDLYKGLISGLWLREPKVTPYVDGTESGTMTGSHILVQGLDGISPRHLTELFVHVVSSGARVVTDPDAEVLDLQGALLVDLNRKRTSLVFQFNAPLRIVDGLQHTTLMLTISPLAFLTLRSFIKKYQNLDLATTVLGAKIRMRYSLGVGLASVGRWRPMT